MRANWIYFLGTDRNPTELFVYGLSLPTKYPKEYSLNIEDLGSVVEGKHLFLFRSIKEVREYLNDDEILLKQFYDKNIKTSIKFIYKNKFIQNGDLCSLEKNVASPINSLVNTTTYYIDDIIKSDFDDETIISLLKKLENNSNQKFYGNYAKRLGTFEIANTEFWSESKKPFEILFDKKLYKYYLHKNKEFDEDIYVILECFHSDIEKTFDKLIVIKKSENDVFFDFDAKNNFKYKYSIYNTNGKLLHQEDIVCIKKIDVNLVIDGSKRKYKIKDDFAEKDNNLINVSIANNPTSSVSIKSPNLNEKIEDIDNFQEGLLNIVKTDKSSETEGRWFNKNTNKLEDIVSYINFIIGNSEKIVIIDPYADKDMLSLAIRLITEEIMIISSQNSSLSDELLKYNINNIINFKQKIKEINIGKSGLDRTKFYFIPKSFHDRFIMICNKNENQVYCLPNSVNAMLKNDDFLILKLNGKVKQQAINHIKNLLKICKEEYLLENIINDKK